MEDALRLVIALVVLVYSCIFHECAHVWVALKMGDPTGKEEGRLTLHPLPHIDLFWTILLPIVTYLTGGFAIGGPKPAPVNPSRTPNPNLTFLLTSVAGPAMNLVLALAGFGLLYALNRIAPDWVALRSYNAIFFITLMATNVFLAMFNLIPVPPLDGSRVLRYVLPEGGKRALDSIERFGAIPIIFAFVILGPYAARLSSQILNLLLRLAYGLY